MRISFIIPSLHYGGVERWCLDLCRHLRHVEVESIISMGEARDRRIREQMERLAPVYELPIKREGSIGAITRDCLDIVGEACRKADAVLVSACGSLIAFQEELKHCARIVVSHVTPEWDGQAVRVRKDVDYATHLVAVSKAAAACFPPARHSIVIPNGVDPARVVPIIGREAQRQAWGIPNGAKVALYVGRFHEIKNQDRLLDALHHLPDEWYAVFLGGSGPIEEVRRMQIRAGEELPGRVRFVPPNDHVGDALAAADCLVITSKAESGPLVMYEAMLAGLPVVSTRFQAIDDLEAEYGTISVSCPQSAPSSTFSQAITYSSPGSVALQAQRVAQRFTSPVMAHNWEKFLLSDVLDWHRARCTPEPFFPEPVEEKPYIEQVRVVGEERSKPKVVFLSPSFQAIGGVETWMRTLAKYSSYAIDWSLANVQTQFCPKPSIQTLDSIGVPYTIDDVASLAADADMIVCWGLPSARRWLRGYSGPLALVSHGSNEWTRRWVQALEPYADHYVGVSKHAAEVFTQASRVIHNGIDNERLVLNAEVGAVRSSVRAAWGLNESDIAVGFIGRISDEKNPVAIARACNLLSKRYRPVFIGPDVSGGRIGKEIKKECERSIFAQPVDQIGEVYVALDCVVVASQAEGFSLVTVEALDCGCPLISTPVGILPEIEEEFGQVAFPLPLGATDRMLADAIKIAWVPNVSVVNRGLKAAKMFTGKHMAESWVKFIYEAVKWSPSASTATLAPATIS